MRYSDETLNRYLAQNDQVRRAAMTDPVTYARMEILREVLQAVEDAGAWEGVDVGTLGRVLDRVVWGDPEGATDVHAEREALMRLVANRNGRIHF